MIHLDFEGKCEDCKCADLELIKVDSFNGEKDWFVQCIHEASCCRMQNKADEAEGEA